jgi:hypothetical protein
LVDDIAFRVAEGVAKNENPVHQPPDAEASEGEQHQDASDEFSGVEAVRAEDTKEMVEQQKRAHTPGASAGHIVAPSRDGMALCIGEGTAKDHYEINQYPNTEAADSAEHENASADFAHIETVDAERSEEAG